MKYILGQHNDYENLMSLSKMCGTDILQHSVMRGLLFGDILDDFFHHTPLEKT
jgi:hypothetical protein